MFMVILKASHYQSDKTHQAIDFVNWWTLMTIQLDTTSESHFWRTSLPFPFCISGGKDIQNRKMARRIVPTIRLEKELRRVYFNIPLFFKYKTSWRWSENIQIQPNIYFQQQALQGMTPPNELSRNTYKSPPKYPLLAIPLALPWALCWALFWTLQRALALRELDSR